MISTTIVVTLSTQNGPRRQDLERMMRPRSDENITTRYFAVTAVSEIPTWRGRPASAIGQPVCGNFSSSQRNWQSQRQRVVYERLALKRDGFGNIMKRMAQPAGIENEGRFTNTSGRKTAAQSSRDDFDPVEISELVVHANPSTIQSYSHNSFHTQREICHRLAGCSSITVHNNMTTSAKLSKNGSQQTLWNIFNLSTLN